MDGYTLLFSTTVSEKLKNMTGALKCNIQKIRVTLLKGSYVSLYKPDLHILRRETLLNQSPEMT